MLVRIQTLEFPRQVEERRTVGFCSEEFLSASNAARCGVPHTDNGQCEQWNKSIANHMQQSWEPFLRLYSAFLLLFPRQESVLICALPFLFKTSGESIATGRGTETAESTGTRNYFREIYLKVNNTDTYIRFFVSYGVAYSS